MPDDVGGGAVKFLSRFADVTSLLGSFPPADPIAANAGRPWLFSDVSGGVLARVKGTGAAALVCSDAGGWGVPQQLGTLRFRRLRTDIWIDPARDGTANAAETSAVTANRGLAIFAAAMFRLQRTDGDVQMWGDLATTGCTLLNDVAFTPVPDGDWMQRGTAFFGVMCSGWAE